MFENPNQEMYDHRNQTIDSWGNDSTGQVEYTFDKYGFRNHKFDVDFAKQIQCQFHLYTFIPSTYL